MDLWPEKAGPRQPVDSSRGPTLTALLRAIQEIEGEFWVACFIRIRRIGSDELVATMRNATRSRAYIDIPLQHIDRSNAAHACGGKTSRHHIENLIDKLRAGIPGLACARPSSLDSPARLTRSSRRLLEFIDALDLNGSASSNIPGRRVAPRQKCQTKSRPRSRTRAIESRCRIQQKIAHELAREKSWTRLKLLVDQPHIGRTEADAPDVDARVVLSKPAPVGDSLAKQSLEAADTISWLGLL